MADGDLAIIGSIIIFLSFLSFFNLLMPASYRFISTLNLSVFSVETIAVAGTCVVATGIPCALALVLYTVSNFLITYFVPVVNPSLAWVGTLIFTPISIILVVFISKLARGN